MTKIYVNTSGEYSDYRINATFLDRAIAEAFTAKYGGDIEEFGSLDTIEAFTGPPGKTFYTTVMYRNGDTEYTSRRAAFERYGDPPIAQEFAKLHHARGKAFLEVGCWADDEQHAIKITNEKRAQLIAENMFPETIEEMKQMEGAVYTP